MKKININNFNIYKISHNELNLLKKAELFYGICDMCNKKMQNNIYYIPVLHYGVCEDCYEEWIKNAIYYKDDEKFMKKSETWIENISKQLQIKIEEEI